MKDGPVVVGVDGSPAAAEALAWAAQEARLRCAELLVVYASGTGETAGLSAATCAAIATEQARYARRLLAEAETAVTGPLHPPVRAEHYPATPVEALTRLSEAAQLVVVGRRRDDTHSVLLGSVSQRVADHARCPVLVVPGDRRPERHDQPVIGVGVGRSLGAMAALEAAFAHAARAGGRVLAVRVWGELDWTRAMSMYNAETAERWRLASRHLLDTCVADVAESYRDVPVELRLIRGPLTASLLDVAAESDLLLLGGREREDPRCSQLGSTATTMLAQARCPVEIVGRPVPVAAHAAPVRQPAVAASRR